MDHHAMTLSTKLSQSASHASNPSRLRTRDNRDKNNSRSGAAPGCGTFRVPILFSGLRRLVYLVRKGCGPPGGANVKKVSPYSITERRVPELIPVLCSQPAGDVSHKPGGRLPLISAGLQLPPQPLRGLLPISLLGEQRHDGCERFA